MDQEGFFLTESQLQALEKAKEEKEAHGEIESEHAGYLRVRVWAGSTSRP